MINSVYFTLKLTGHGHLSAKLSAISCNEILQSTILPVPRNEYVNEYFGCVFIYIFAAESEVLIMNLRVCL